MDDDDLRFEWDDAKARSNLNKHGVCFETAAGIFLDEARLEDDDLFAKGEYRAVAIGKVDEFILTVVFTEPEENLIRLISARLATPKERKAYEQNLFHA